MKARVALVVLLLSAQSTALGIAGAQEAEPSLTLRVSPGVVTSGEAATFSGSLTGTPECIANRRVEYGLTAHGSGREGGSGLATTDENGMFSTPLPVQLSADYFVAVRQSAGCPAVVSNEVTVLARARVSARAASDRVPKGMQGAIAGNVHPGHPGTRVKLQRRADGRWRNIRRAALDDNSQFGFTFKVSWNRKRVFRVVWKAQDDDHVTGRSARIRIRSVSRP